MAVVVLWVCGESLVLLGGTEVGTKSPAPAKVQPYSLSGALVPTSVRSLSKSTFKDGLCKPMARVVMLGGDS